MAQARIMIVEDESIVALDLKNRLIRLGYLVPAITDSGEKAIKKAVETRPDLVLMDVRLKGDMDGVEAAQEIQARFDIPVIYLSALVDRDTTRKTAATAPGPYIIKPFEEAELYSAIKAALDLHQRK